VIVTVSADVFRVIIVTHLFPGQALHSVRYFSSAMATWHLQVLKDEVLAHIYPNVEGEWLAPWHLKGYQPPTRSKPSASSASAAADDDQVSVTAVPGKQAADEADEVSDFGARASDSEWLIHPANTEAADRAEALKQAADEAAEIRACVVRARQRNDMQVSLLPLHPDETVHTYMYISSLMVGKSVLSLQEMSDQPGYWATSRTCTFMTKGHCTDNHGYWTLTNGVLEAWFNYRWESGRNSHMMLLHPTRLYRMDDGTWEGMDDKACIIRLEHVRSRARHGQKSTYSEPL
jgi:hypothetical protein